MLRVQARQPSLLTELRGLLAGRPLVPLALALVGGAVAADSWRLPLLVPLGLTALGLGVALLSSWRGASGGLLAAAAGLGAFLHSAAVTPLRSDVSKYAGAPVTAMEVAVTARVSQNAWEATCDCRARWAQTEDGLVHRLSGSVRVKLPATAQPVNTGDVVQLSELRIELPRAPTNWFQADRRRQLARRGIHAIVHAESAHVRRAGRGWRARMGAVGEAARQYAVGALRRAMGGPHAERDAGLLAGMVFGERAVGLDETVQELFRRTGTVHLLVVSGAQVSVVLLLILDPGRLLFRRRHGLGPRPPRWWHLALIALALLLLSLMAGMGVSIVRSLLMCGLWLTARLTGRPSDGASGISLAAIVLTLSNTALVFDVGAQLTFAATIGVVLFLTRGQRRPGTDIAASHPVISAGLATLGAWLCVTPLLAHYFTSFALLGSLANLVAVPLSGVVVILGLLAVLASLFFGWLAAGLCAVARVLLWAILGVNRFFDWLPATSVDGVYLSAAGCLAWYAAAGVVVFLWQTGRLGGWWRHRRGPVLVAGVSGVAALVVVFAVRELWPRAARVVVFDVGEGLCVLVETPNRHALLYDAGGRGSLTRYEIAHDLLAPYLAGRGLRRVDAVVISHPDSDHYGAVPHLARRVPVGIVLINGMPGEESYQQALAALTRHGAQVRVARQGAAVNLGGVGLEVLWPPGARVPLPPGDNNASLVARVRLDGLTLLLPGDLEASGLRALLASVGADALTADLLVLPHHGRSSANEPAFLDAVQAKVVVVSRGSDNRGRLAELASSGSGASSLVTAEEGAVMAWVHSGRVMVRTYLGRR